jgi:hypothetical protein
VDVKGPFALSMNNASYLGCFDPFKFRQLLEQTKMRCDLQMTMCDILSISYNLDGYGKKPR